MLADRLQHPDGSRKYVLVVEGNRRDRAALARALSDRGYVVDTAFPGREALRQLASAPYAAVVMDIHLPGELGPDPLRTVRVRAPHAAVIVVTGSASFGNAVRALRAGVGGYILKPADPEAVVAALQRLEARQTRLQAGRRVLERACGAVAAWGWPRVFRRPDSAIEGALRVPPLVLDEATGELSIVGGREPSGRVTLSPGEVQLLGRLMTDPDTVWSCSRLAAAPGQEPLEHPLAQSLVRPIIARLRARMVRLGLSGDVIRTVRGRGYRLDVARLSEGATSSRAPSATRRPAAWHILLADGDWSDARSLAWALRAAGQRVITVTRGSDALVQLDALVYDVLVTDPRWLQVSAEAWLSEVRQRHPTLPLVVLSARPSWEDACAAVRVAADAFLVKPVGPADLLTEIERVMQRRAAWRRGADLAAAVVDAAMARQAMASSSSMPAHSSPT